MAKKFAKVNVKHVSCGTKHDVVIVAITDAKKIGSHTAACTRIDEVFCSLQSNGRPGVSNNERKNLKHLTSKMGGETISN